MGIVCCCGPHPSTCAKRCYGNRVVFYQQVVLLHRVEGELLYVDYKGRKVSEIIDVYLFSCYEEK